MFELQTAGGKYDGITESDDIPFYVCTIKVHWRFAERQRYGSVTVNGNQHQQDSSKSVKQF
jgi:hypothetical protein